MSIKVRKKQYLEEFQNFKIMTLEREKYLSFVKYEDFDVKNVTMEEMLFWSKHNIFSHIEFIFTLVENQIKKKNERN